ncbi:MAG TPA: carboxymuconolactone decarboxylase family protein, partial [Caulobacteraceae bacterium]|nr:carboxymuconolactone decarboxylase family protein [Caulobacteraceae bacterium]
DEQKALTERLRRGDSVPNIYRTLANHPPAMKAFLGWGGYILGGGNTLPDRERELAILRVGWLSRAGYEWVAHVRIGKNTGLTDAEIEAIKQGSSAPGWSEADREILKGVEELHADRFITDATWAALAARWRREQVMDLVYTVGQYTQVCMILNSFGIQLDGGAKLDPDIRQAWGV